MEKTSGVFPIMEHKEVANKLFVLKIYAPSIAKTALPGQFINITVSDFFLPRPIAICATDIRQGAISVIYEAKGKGTKALSAVKSGDNIRIFGPLGNGFNLLPAEEKVVLVGGGIGVTPLLPLAKHFGSNAIAILGFATSSSIILVREFEAAGCKVILTTDDGSSKDAFKGVVTDYMPENIIGAKKVYACGPTPMLKSVNLIAESKNIPCEVSLEERMGCGVGACLVCVCKIKEGESYQNKRCCKDGPVFDGSEVVF